jgi:23S rRNA pseudouridine2605 synthase
VSKEDKASSDVRLQKFLSRAGVASRRRSERLIEAGRVRVDGELVTELGVRVDPASSVVEVDGRRVELTPILWIALHKPPAYLCSRGDPRGRPTVYDLLPQEQRGRLFHVGRLDFMSEGLLLLCNEGDVANQLLHPSGEMQRRYVVTVAEPVPADLVRRLEDGVPLEGGAARVARATMLTPAKDGEQRLLILLREGRNRHIRRMLQTIGVRISSLQRVAFGPVELGDLRPGEHRVLTPSEVERLRAFAKRRSVERASGDRPVGSPEHARESSSPDRDAARLHGEEPV